MCMYIFQEIMEWIRNMNNLLLELSYAKNLMQIFNSYFHSIIQDAVERY